MRCHTLIHNAVAAFDVRIHFVVLFLFMSGMELTYSQCAGEDNTVTVCNKYDNNSNRTFDLFQQLNGMPTQGGVWSTTDPANLDALDINTGILDLWRVNYFGAHEFTYTNTDGNCIEDVATITILLGGYAGEDNVDGSANACGDTVVNLFSFLGSQVDEHIPDFNGIWEEDPMTETGLLNENFFNAQEAGPGEYIFTYTVPTVDSCQGEESTVLLEVHKPADSGTPINLEVCTTDDLSGLTNFDLNDLLFGQDPNGTWTEANTNQIENLADHIVDVQEINNTHGFGTYFFEYSVLPTAPVCSESITEVYIEILPALQGSLTASEYCSGTDYEVTLTYDDTLLPAGNYSVECQINSSQGIENFITTLDLGNGTGTFSVPPSAVPINEVVQLNVVGIEGIQPQHDVCSSIAVQQTELMAYGPSASSESVCPNNNVAVQLLNVLNSLGNLANGPHTIDYTLTSPESSTNFILEDVNFVDGAASFEISGSNTEISGAYTLDISVADSFEMDCAIGTGFQVTPLPEEIELGILVDNNCSATSVDVVINAPALSDGVYMIDYELVELVSQTTLIDNSINFSGGLAEYEIDIANLPDGDYNVILQSTQNDTAPCRVQFDFELQEAFSIGGAPEVVEAEAEQTFCLNNGIPTLENISVSASGSISFYATDSDNEALPTSTSLTHGEDYFISSTNPVNNCVSQQRVRVQVTLVEASAPTTTQIGPAFCAAGNFTLADLDIIGSNGGSIIWYTSAQGGTQIDSSEILVNGQSYFAAEQVTGACESETRLEIAPIIIMPPIPDLKTDQLLLCGLNNPTVSELENIENTIDAEIEWFDRGEGGEALSSLDPLMDDTTYYAQSYDVISGCINPNRVPVAVDLNNCIPEEHGFFIPDGFSPNNDGRNDTFFIPNIEIIFPDFTLEIFNRYGNSIFKGNINNPAWDGSETGNQASPNGVYFYIISFNKEGFDPKQGRLYLNR